MQWDALEDRRYTQGPNKFLSLVWLWHQCGHHSEGLADLDHEDDFSSIEQGVNNVILKKKSSSSCLACEVQIQISDDLACNCSRVAHFVCI